MNTTITSSPQNPAYYETTKRKAPVSRFNLKAEKLFKKKNTSFFTQMSMWGGMMYAKVSPLHYQSCSV
jgi:hypothetical protein